MVDLGADAPDDAPVAPRAEQLRVAVLEEGVLAAAEEQPALDAQRGDPVRRGRVQPVRELDELAQLLATLHRPHVHGHGGAPYMPETSIDVFAKARDNERVALLRAAREADIVPYFRTVEGPARPVVEMEGAARIMLGSNNYLGLTGDERVIQGARDALERYGTGLTGLAPAQRHDSAAPRARGGDRRLAWGPRTRSSSPPATRPTSARWGRSSAPATPSSPTPATTRRSSTAACSAAPSCAPSATTAWTSSSACSSAPPTTAAACSWSSTACSRWRATSPRCPRSATCASASARA